MKRGILTAALVTVVAAFIVESSAQAATPKLGYVDLQRTLNETKVGKAARDRLEGEKKKRQGEIDKKQADLKKEFEDFEKQKLVLKDDARAKKEADLQAKYVQLQNKFLELQQELTKKEAQLTREIFSQASKEIEAIAKRDGYTMILEKNESAVLWADPTTDITSELNKRLDAAPATGKTSSKK